MNNIMLSKLYDLENGGFWTVLNELVEEIEEIGFNVDAANREYIIVSRETDDDDEEAYQLLLGGTERTIIVREIREID